MSIDIGQLVELLNPLRSGQAKLVAVIGKGSVPDPRQIAEWYGDAAPIPKSAYRALRVDRLIFQRMDTDGFVIVPDHPDVPVLYRTI